MSYDRRHRKANSSKQSLVGQLEFYASLTGAKLLIPLVVNHLMSTCFRGSQHRAESGRTGGYANLTTGPLRWLKTPSALISEGRLALSSTVSKQSRDVVSQTFKRSNSVGRMPASTHTLCFLSFRPCAVSLAVRKDAARRRDILSRVNIVKRIKIGGRWRMFSIPRNAKGNYDWNAIADGRYYVEWYVGGTRRRVSAGVTAAQALEVQRRKHHELEGRKLGIPGFETAGETVKKPALHVAITKYLEQIAALKKPNTHRKYEAVLNRFGEFFRDCVSIDAISGDDLTRFVVTLKKDHGLGSNTILHNAVIVAQFLKRHGRSGITKELPLPERITPLVKIYRHEELARFFAACSDTERALFATFLLTGFREQEVMYLRWSDINFELRTVRVTSKPELGFYPKRWEDREIPAPVELIDELRKHTHRPNCQFVFPSPTGNREQHMLDHCKSIAKRAKLNPTKFDLKTFRSTYATGMLRRGFDVRTVQHWMGHKSLETTMRYLAPATDVHDALDLVTIPSVGKAAPAPRKSVARETGTPRKGRPVRSPVGAVSDALAAKTVS